MCDYRILIPENAGEEIRFAAEELQTWLAEAVGNRYAITDTIPDPSCKVFSIGDTVLLKQHGFAGAYAKLGDQGYRICTADNSIFIFAARDRGVLNGVYGYLERVLHYDYYHEDVYDIDHPAELPWVEMDITDVPDIDTRIGCFGFQRFDETVKRRLKLKNYRDLFYDVGNYGAYHNCFGYISPDEYGKSHPEYFNDKQNQLCYTAHGNLLAREEMIRLCTDRILETFQTSDKDKICLALNDNDDACSCPACRLEMEKYGANTASSILFLNAVAERVETALRQAGDQRADSFMIVFYAYHAFLQAPAKIRKTETGEYILDENGNRIADHHPDMHCCSHVAPIIANSRADLIHGYDDPAYAEYREIVWEWRALADTLYFWVYDNYFLDSGFLIPYCSFRRLPKLYRFTRENHVQALMAEGQPHNLHSTAFVRLKGYLHGKLGWNADADVLTLEKRFFKASYGSAWEDLYAVYEEILENADRQIHEAGLGTWSTQTRGFCQSEYWDRDLLISWIRRMDECEKRLTIRQEMKSASNIRLEMISPLHIFLRTYGDTLNADAKKQIADRLKMLFAEFPMVTVGQSRGDGMKDYLHGIDNMDTNERNG